MFRLKVREVAEHKKISQRQLSMRSGVDPKAIRSMFREEEPNVRLETLAKIAYVLNVDVSLLIESNPALPMDLDAPVRIGPPPYFEEK